MSALEDARARTAEIQRQRNLHNPQYWKAQEEIALAKELELEEAELTKQADAQNELNLRYAKHQAVMEDVLATLRTYVEARARLADAEALLQKAEARARGLGGIDIPAYDSLGFRATRDNEIARLGHLARQVTSSGFLGAR